MLNNAYPFTEAEVKATNNRELLRKTHYFSNSDFFAKKITIL